MCYTAAYRLQGTANVSEPTMEAEYGKYLHLSSYMILVIHSFDQKVASLFAILEKQYH